MFDIGVRVKKAPLKGGEPIRRSIREKAESDLPGCISVLGITGLALVL